MIFKYFFFIKSLNNELSKPPIPTKLNDKTKNSNDIHYQPHDIQNPQIYKISQLLNKKPATKSSDHKPENPSKSTNEMFYKSVFKPKNNEEKMGKNIISKKNNDAKISLEFNNEKSLTIPNENSFRDEKLDNKIKKNILDFSKNSSGSKKISQDSKDPYNPNPEKVKDSHNLNDKILMFSDSFSRYHLNSEKDKEKKILNSGKITPSRSGLMNKNANDESKAQPLKYQENPTINPKIKPGFSTSINTIKTLIQYQYADKKNEFDINSSKKNVKDNLLGSTEIKKTSDSLKKSSIDFQIIDSNSNSNKKEIYNKPMSSNESSKHKKNDNNIEEIKQKNMEYYLKNGILQSYIIEKSESNFLFEMLEKLKFDYYVCESIKEQKDELKLFITSNTQYTTSTRILVLTTCNKIN